MKDLNFGQYLRHHRKQCKVGVRQLAQHLGLTHATISQVELEGKTLRPVYFDRVQELVHTIDRAHLEVLYLCCLRERLEATGRLEGLEHATFTITK